MELRTACRKMKYLKKMMSRWGDRQQQTPRSNRLRVVIEQQLIYRNERWKPVPFKLKIERQNTKRYSAYMLKPRQCAQSRHSEIQDCVQRRLRSTFKFIQYYLVRTGRRGQNPGISLFHQVLETNIREFKEEGRLEEDT
ncbi:MAG: hypothetical protein EZS28_010133 [Streblomastix strix]|uniref:Uncharacterized protein n=1 Tax=Streblomastix strix TaxID=222440 RepID=A0A5J4WHP1_9EUKA|nr:MAG: hypothetical protein EZS28_010133 [Streblomastix strix]